MILDVWQIQELRSDFADVWQGKDLVTSGPSWSIQRPHPATQCGTQRPCPVDSFGIQRQDFGEGEIRYTRQSVAGSTLRVNYFIGTVRMDCGKSAGIPRGLTGSGQAGQTQSAHGAPGGPF